jgi:hypothetical protein
LPLQTWNSLYCEAFKYKSNGLTVGAIEVVVVSTGIDGVAVPHEDVAPKSLTISNYKISCFFFNFFYVLNKPAK